jgi:hypothetical protein
MGLGNLLYNVSLENDILGERTRRREVYIFRQGSGMTIVKRRSPKNAVCLRYKHCCDG